LKLTKNLKIQNKFDKIIFLLYHKNAIAHENNLSISNYRTRQNTRDLSFASSIQICHSTRLLVAYCTTATIIARDIYFTHHITVNHVNSFLFHSLFIPRCMAEAIREKTRAAAVVVVLKLMLFIFLFNFQL
jgi:hypothetical protein